MDNDGIIRNIEHHTDWCSAITTSVKNGGSLRVCLDTKRLNEKTTISIDVRIDTNSRKAYP